MRSKTTLWFAALTSLFFVLSMGCSESESATCGAPEDCPSDQVCRGGVCKLPSQATCTNHQDCASGYLCVARSCARQPTPDVGHTDVDDNQPDVNVPPDLGTPDTDTNNTTNNQNNQTPLRVVSTTPAGNATGVGVDTTFEITFNKSINTFTLIATNFELSDPDGRTVASTPTYDDTSHTVTVTPAAPLAVASRYRLRVSADVQDINGDRLGERVDAYFFTVHDEREFHQLVAATYAPVVYQSIRNPAGAGLNVNIPTTIDFDGDMNLANNKTRALSANTTTQAHVYYNVLESKTHYLVQYVLYYPARHDFDLGEHYEHDMTGIVVVVDKETEDVQLVEGVRVMQSEADDLLAFKPSSSTVTNRSGATHMETFDASGLAGTTQYPLMVPSGQHAPCNWYRSGPATACRGHQGQAFVHGAENGVVMRAGDVAQGFADAVLNEDTGLKEMTYELVSFVDTFWMNRSDYSCGVYGQGHVLYNPDGAGRPTGIGEEALVLPRKLCTNDEFSYGQTPFTWRKLLQTSSGGRWFLDPAQELIERFDFGDEESFSTDYCHNIFFNIDHIDDPDHPDCSE